MHLGLTLSVVKMRFTSMIIGSSSCMWKADLHHNIISCLWMVSQQLLYDGINWVSSLSIDDMIWFHFDVARCLWPAKGRLPNPAHLGMDAFKQTGGDGGNYYEVTQYSLYLVVVYYGHKTWALDFFNLLPNVKKFFHCEWPFYLYHICKTYVK